jgi:hypothetical protein
MRTGNAAHFFWNTNTMNLFKPYFNRRKRLDFMRRHEMSFNGFGGLVIHGLVASEFGYLLRYVTNGELEQVRDFEAIRAKKNQILSEIQTELMQPQLRESEVFRVSREVAAGNLENLRSIVECISDYVDLCRSLGLSLAPDAGVDQRFMTSLVIWAGGAMAIASLIGLLLDILGWQLNSTWILTAIGVLGGFAANLLQESLTTHCKNRGKHHD